jgi:hypothetical protein
VGDVKRIVVLGICVAALAVTLVASAAVVNGDFETGDLTGWTTFTTANGTIGTPAVVSFDTTGTGASNAAEFAVGVAVPALPAVGEGGGIHQSVNTVAGEVDVSADVALHLAEVVSNVSCGLFELLVDGAVVASHDFGECLQSVTERSTLSATGLALAAGSHEIRIRITRPARNVAGRLRHYVDNVSLTQVVTELPTTKDQCKKGGWMDFGVFKNQGDCVSFVASGGENPPAGG